MSSIGRCQDALYDLFSYEMGDGTVVDGPVKLAGITYAQWHSIVNDVIGAVYPIAHTQGIEAGARFYGGEVSG